MMVVIAILINIFIAYHFKKYLNKHRVVAAVIIVLVAVSVSIEMIILGFLINLCICLIIADLIYLLIFKTKLKRPYQKVYLIGVLICSLSLSVYGIYNANNIVITNYQVSINKEFKDKKIMALSDIHLGTAVKTVDLKQLVTQAEKIKPDMIFLVGDVYDENTSSDEIDDSMKIFTQLAKSYPVYYVIGNHEVGYSSSPLKEYNILERLQLAGVNTLNDEYVEFEDINIVGRQDYKIKKRKPVEQIINGMNQNKPVILLDHQPRSLEENKKIGIDLMISGHTHAGQVFPMLPLWNLLGINEMNYGYRHDDNFNAIVSSGMGTWGFAMRTSKNCEIVVIDLISK